MAGTAAASELSPRFAIATREDDAAIRRLLRETPMHGAISVTFEREPDYFRGANLAGGVDQTIVAFAGDRLVCMGRCTQRECWVNEAARRVGYLGELRLDAAARGRFGIVRDGYRFFHEQQRDDPADLYFTSIAADNERARRLLEGGARGLPGYTFLAELETLAVALRRGRRRNDLRRGVAATTRHLPAMLRVLNEHARRHPLAAVWTVETLHALERHGLPLERFLLAFAGDEIVACGALWDQRAFRQTVVHGTTLAHAFLSPLAFAEGAEAMLPDFIEAFFPLAAEIGIEFLTLALPATDARLPGLRARFSTHPYRSRLYRVDWPEQQTIEAAGAFLPDVALL